MRNLALAARVATLSVGVVASSAVHAAAPDATKDYPNKPIRLVAPFVPGGGSDTTARAIALKLSERWGQQVVVDNRTGAAGAIGVEITAQAIPDGYTICVISASHAVLSATNSKLPYDLARDLQGISQATSLFYVLTVPVSSPAKSVKEFIAYAKANPGKLNFASSGVGSLQHFSWELFKHSTGTQLTHVPYKGAAGSLVGMLAGEIQAGFFSMFGVRPHLASGRVRVLAISASKRSPLLPEYPTVAEAGVPGYEVDQWYGFVTSARVPRAIVAKLQAAMADALRAPDVARRLGTDGSTPVGSSPEQFSAHIQSEIAKWRKLVKDAGLTLK
ncbi:MAG: tripartite tricarboxylate transporter substrate binding protein [Betaproteobacteria bacterium]|nr:tripartite tricarboxylate transporter substrate binding protein [Betaproteobacteria bacterium]